MRKYKFLWVQTKNTASHRIVWLFSVKIHVKLSLHRARNLLACSFGCWLWIHNIDLLEYSWDMLKIDEYLPYVNCIPRADMYKLVQLLTLEQLSAHLIVRCVYAAFHEMALTSHIEGSMITAIWTHLRMFQNSKLYQFMLNVEFYLGRC
jgi:hypothetical protein